MESSQFTVLIVDDHVENLIALEAILEDLNVRLFKANSGNEALGVLLEHNISLVLLDVQMPDMDGFEVAKLMKQSERTKYIPVIFITALSNEERYQFMAYNTGAVDFISKPVIPEILLSKVNVFMQLHDQKEKIIQQAIKLEIANNKLKDLSYLDGLTQIPNRRKLELYLNEVWHLAKKNEENISIIMMDIDFFKPYNDYYGHIAGDDCLKKVATALENVTIQEQHFIARYGGEEFIVVMRDSNVDSAKIFAIRLFQTVLDLEINHQKSSISQFVTISAGVSTLIPNSDTESNDLINKADQALYKAKDLGRSQVVVI